MPNKPCFTIQYNTIYLCVFQTRMHENTLSDAADTAFFIGKYIRKKAEKCVYNKAYLSLFYFIGTNTNILERKKAE